MSMQQSLLNAIGGQSKERTTTKVLVSGFHPSFFVDSNTHVTLKGIWTDRVFTENEVIHINFQATRNQAVVTMRGRVSDAQIQVYDKAIASTMRKLADAIPRHLTSIVTCFEETARTLRASLVPT